MAAWESPKVCTTLQIISVFILSVQRSVLLSRRDAACEYCVPTTVPFHSERAATMRNCKAKVPASPRVPLLSLCGRRLMPPNPGAAAAAVGGMRRADGASAPPTPATTARPDHRGAPQPRGGCRDQATRRQLNGRWRRRWRADAPRARCAPPDRFDG